MSALFPYAAYAEDQPLGKTILAVHVGYRGFQSGAVIGIPFGLIKHLRSRRMLQPITAGVALITRPALSRAVVSSMGTGSVIGTASVLLLLPFYMRGKEDIEWKDRSWRLLANEGQVEVDNWSIAGSAVGLGSYLTSSVRSPDGRVVWKAIMGRTAVGNLLGVVGYMGWRYGVHGGKRDAAVH